MTILGRRGIRILVGVVSAFVVIGSAIAAGVAGSGRIGPRLHLTGNGRLLRPPGQLVTLGHFPTGGAVTPASLVR